MKRTLLFLLAIVSLVVNPALSNAEKLSFEEFANEALQNATNGDIAINETNFPDDNFRNWLSSKKYGQDGVLTESEIAGVRSINVERKNISSLKGIEYFTALTWLECSYNQLSSLDVSKNIALEYIDCIDNQLSSLDVSKNTALKNLNCSCNLLTSLDVSKNTALKSLSCCQNQLTSLDVSNNTALIYLLCYFNQLTSLDVSKNTALTELQCHVNKISGTNMDNLIKSLPKNTTDSEYSFYVIANIANSIGYECNVCTKSQVAAVKAKGWKPQYWDGTSWVEYEGSEDNYEKGTTPENPLTIAEAIKIGKSLGKGCSSEKFYYIHGTGGYLNFIDSHYYNSQLYGGGTIEDSDDSYLRCRRVYYLNYKVPLENILLEECDVIIYAELTNKAEDVEKTNREKIREDNNLEITDGYIYSINGYTGSLEEKDLIVSRSLEGVDMVFSIIDAENKTCMVGGEDPVNDGRYYYAVTKDYSGEVTIPEYAHEYKVTGINNYAFESHSGLTGVSIPNSMTYIHEKAFENCYGLNKVIVSDLAAWCGITFESNPLSIAHHLYNEDGKEIMDLIIPDGVETINSYAFNGGSYFTSITIPGSLKTISNYSFYGCNNLKKVIIPNIGGWCNIQLSNSNPLSIAQHIFSDSETEIFDLKIPDGVSTINPYTFSGCNNLKTVSIPSSLTTIGSDAFAGCNSLEKVIVSDLAAWCGISYTKNTDNPLSIAHNLYNKDGTEITDLIIPEGVKTINSYAFYGGSNFTSVTIPSSLKTISSNSFFGCDNLSKVIVPDLMAWCNIDFGSNPLSISGHLYSDNEHEILDLIIPYGVTNISEGAFNYGKFSSVAFPGSLKTIGDLAFAMCPEISSVVIPNGVTSIGMGAFVACEKLSTVVIPNSVKSIGEYAFGNCLSLYSVTSLINIPFNLDESAFQCLNSDYDQNIIYMAATLYVPRGRTAMYSNIQGWKKFTNIMETDTKFNLTYMVDGEVYKKYEIQATEVITPEPDPYKEGYIFSGWSTIPRVMPAHDVTVTGSFYADPSSVKGDVNGDGKVGIGDIVTVTNVMAGEGTGEVIKRADVNGDGEVGIGDIISITNIMAGE